MRDVDKALADIVAIRAQLARQSAFRGYGPVTMAATGCLAAFVAVVQTLFEPQGSLDAGPYFLTWIGAAVVAMLVIGVEVLTRSRRLHSGLANAMIVSAAEAFLPAGMAGALIGAVLAVDAPEALWMRRVFGRSW